MYQSMSYVSNLEQTVQSSPVYRTNNYVPMHNIKQGPIYMKSSPLEAYLANSIDKQFQQDYLASKLFHDYSPVSKYNPITAPLQHKPHVFLQPDRPKTPRVENLTPHLKKKIRQVFRLTTNMDMPDDILISVLNNHSFKDEHRRHSKFWSPGIQGFAINRKHIDDVSSVFVKENPLDELMLTLGHEIGHCLTLQKPNPIDEEAKAFAFELAWINTIREFDILGLRNNIKPLNPASNGLHNIALEKVMTNLRTETDPFQIFKKFS